MNFKGTSENVKLLFNKKQLYHYFLGALLQKALKFLYMYVVPSSIILITPFNHEQLLGYMHFGVLAEHCRATH